MQHIKIMNKTTLTALLFLFFSVVIAQEKTDEQEFLLDGPESWRKELLTLPLRFAPELDYKGLEFVRFSKGWSDKTSDEFWTYKFAWYLDEPANLTTERLNKELQIYFDNLLNLVGKGKGIAKEKITATKATLSYSKRRKTYKGQVTIFDVFFSETLQTLNIKVSPSYCDTSKKHIVYFEFSPQPFKHKLWKVMKDITIACD